MRDNLFYDVIKILHFLLAKFIKQTVYHGNNFFGPFSQKHTFRSESYAQRHFGAQLCIQFYSAYITVRIDDEGYRCTALEHIRYMIAVVRIVRAAEVGNYCSRASDASGIAGEIFVSVEVGIFGLEYVICRRGFRRLPMRVIRSAACDRCGEFRLQTVLRSVVPADEYKAFAFAILYSC